MIPVAFDYERATSIDDAIAKLGGIGRRQADRRRAQPGAADEAAPERARHGSSTSRGFPACRASGKPAAASRSAPPPRITRSPSSKLLRDKCPMVAEAAAEIGDPQVRNRGTIGGSIAHADPAADFPAVMLALDAEIQLKGKSGSRTVKASAFFRGFYAVDLAPGEMIVGVQFAPVKSAAYAKLHQRASHYAIVGVAAVARREGRRDPVGAHRPDRRDDARGAVDRRREGAGRQEGGWRLRRRAASAAATSPT